VRDKPPHDPPPIVIAYQWAARITTLAIEMVVPGLAGVWIDGRLGTKVLFTLAGFAAGITFAIWQLIKIAGQTTDERPEHKGPTKRGKLGP